MVGAQPIEGHLHQTVENYKLSEPTFLDALVTVASKFEVPIGVELVRSPSVLRPVEFSWRRATVMEVLTALARSQGEYGLRTDDGVLHVFRKDEDKKPGNFLNIRLGTFDAEHEIAPLVDQDLWIIVNGQLYPRPAGTGGIGRSLGARTDDRPVTVKLRDTTVRAVLDSLILASEYKVWVVTFSPDESLLPTGFRRTASPTSGKAHPDSDQPGWEMLRWGERPY